LIYEESEEYKNGLVLAEFISKSFNASSTLGNRPGVKGELIYHLRIKFNVLNKYFVGGSDQIFQAFRPSTMSAATCSGLTSHFSAHDYVAPFQSSLWLTTFIFFGIFGTALWWAFRTWKVADSPWVLIISFLLEHSLSVSTKLELNPHFRYIFGSFLLMGVVITNGYKGVVTTSLIKPFALYGLDSIDVAINARYEMFYNPEAEAEVIRATACKNNSDISVGITNEIMFEFFTQYTHSFLYDAWGMGNATRKHNFLLKLRKAKWHFENLNDQVYGPNTSTGDVILLQCIKLMKPKPCPLKGTGIQALLKCNNSLYILPTSEIDDFIFKATLDPKTYKGLYKIPDQAFQRVLPGTLLGYNLHWVHNLKHIFQRPARIFLESGVYEHLHSLHREKKKAQISSETTHAQGSLEERHGIQALNLETKAGIAFIFYGIGICMAWIYISLELGYIWWVHMRVLIVFIVDTTR